MPALFIGDIHGDFDAIDRIIADYGEDAHKGPIIQVGDMGLGFPSEINLATGKPFRTDPEGFPENFYFIRGNHDNPKTCEGYSAYLGNYGSFPVGNSQFFFVSGAPSMDRELRIHGISWWPEEELSQPELLNAIYLYEQVRPSVMVTHTCPIEAARLVVHGSRLYGSRTEHALAQMWEIHKPKLWIFGHWHVDRQFTLLGTQFLCLAPNSAYWLDLEDGQPK